MEKLGNMCVIGTWLHIVHDASVQRAYSGEVVDVGRRRLLDALVARSVALCILARPLLWPVKVRNLF